MAYNKDEGVCVGRDCIALDQAATKARSRTFYAKRKNRSDHPRLSSAIEVANAVLAYGMDSHPGKPSGHPNPVNVVPIADRTPGFSHTNNPPTVGSELPRPGAPVRYNDVTAAIQALDAINPQIAKIDAALIRFAADVQAGRKTLQNAQQELKGMFPGLDSDMTDLGHFMADARASDAGLSVQQIIDSI